MWKRGSFLGEYATRELRPVEIMFLIRYRDQLRDRVLELGCGAGRLTSYLIQLASEVHGIDVSPAMIEHCQRNFPGAVFHLGDFTDLSGFASDSFAAVLAPCNVLDVLRDTERRAVLERLRDLLVPDGLLFFSSHNRSYVPNLRRPWQFRRTPKQLVADVVRLPRSLRNHRRLVAYEEHNATYDIINDSAHGYSLLHYYISRNDAERQLEACGFEFLKCWDLNGEEIDLESDTSDFVELHYLARRAPSTANAR